MRFYYVLFFVGFLQGNLAQIGIKTHRVVSGNYVVNRTDGGGTLYPVLPVGQSGPIPMDPVTLFINRTRSQMATGVCFKEVPTATLVKDKSAGIPRGNSSDPSMSVIQICCDGYERNIHNFLQCDPICKDGCINGICVAPNDCRCFPDSVRNLAGFCIPTCPIGCGNGECQTDGSCRCKPGYILEPSQKKFCISVCSQGCLNGNCTAPDVCECRLGYQNSAAGNCEPKCENCKNGRCVGPGSCECNPGYARKENLCLPVCPRGCGEGVCIAPGQCQCAPGWSLDDTGFNCIPHCERACLNGRCTGSNSCSCNPGYILDSENPFICNPHCPSGCPNGVCTAPNMCLCKPGFVKDRGVKGRQQCVPAI